MATKAEVEVEGLRLRLEEAEETLNAIRTGAVDALVVSGLDGERVYTLKGADHSYRLLLEKMNEGAASLMPEGHILYCNRRFSEMLGIPLEKIIGVSSDTLVAAADRTAFAALLQQASQESAKSEIAFSREDGTVFPVYCSLSPLKIDDMECLCLIATDLTTQKRSEEVVASEKLARSILEQAVDVIIVCDEKGTIIRASRAAHELGAGNVLQQRFEKVFDVSSSPTDGSGEGVRPLEPSIVSACLEGRTVQGGEARWQRADGTKFDLLLSGGPLRDGQGRVCGCVLTLTDITHRKRVEERLREAHAALEERVKERTAELIEANSLLYEEIAERRRAEQKLRESELMAAVGVTAAVFAHEIGNPLNGISTTMQLLERYFAKQGPQDATVVSTLRDIRKEVNRLGALLHEFRSFSGSQRLNLQPTDLRPLIKELLAVEESHCAACRIQVESDFPEDFPLVMVDSEKIKQAMLNLCKNSIEAMAEGGALKVVGYRSGEDVSLEVADTGPGIPQGVEIFELFKTTKPQGTGLGLPIVRQIVTAHGGTIGYRSEPGKGTVFHLTFPALGEAFSPSRLDQGEGLQEGNVPAPRRVTRREGSPNETR